MSGDTVRTLTRAVTADLVNATADALAQADYELIGGTACGVLKPLFTSLELRTGQMRYFHREDTAVAFAAGVALAGGKALLLMQNSGLGQSVNVLASLVAPFRIPLALVVSMRGTGIDTTEENIGMGRAAVPVITALGITYRLLDPVHAAESVRWLNDTVTLRRRPAALLVPPEAIGWSANG